MTTLTPKTLPAMIERSSNHLTSDINDQLAGMFDAMNDAGWDTHEALNALTARTGRTAGTRMSCHSRYPSTTTHKTSRRCSACTTEPSALLLDGSQPTAGNRPRRRNDYGKESQKEKG